MATGTPATFCNRCSRSRCRLTQRRDDRAPGEAEFTIPGCPDPRAIISYALHRLDVIIVACQAFLGMMRGWDEVSFALVVGLLAAGAHRRADAMAARAGQRVAA